MKARRSDTSSRDSTRLAEAAIPLPLSMADHRTTPCGLRGNFFTPRAYRPKTGGCSLITARGAFSRTYFCSYTPIPGCHGGELQCGLRVKRFGQAVVHQGDQRCQDGFTLANLLLS